MSKIVKSVLLASTIILASSLALGLVIETEKDIKKEVPYTRGSLPSGEIDQKPQGKLFNEDVVDEKGGEGLEWQG